MEGCSLPAQKPGEGRKKQPEEEFPGLPEPTGQGAGTTTSSCWTLPFPRRRSTRRAWRRHQQKTVYPGDGLPSGKLVSLRVPTLDANVIEELCDGAVEGLEWKEHPNPSWRRKGVKLYWYEGQGMEVEKVKNQSLTKAKQSVELDADHFEEVESRLALQPGEGQLVLGKSSGSRGSGNPPKPKPGDGKDDDEHVPTPEEVEAEAYKKAPARRRPSRV